MYQLQKLRPRHHEILRLLFLGMNHKEVAERLGITPVTVGIVMNSPLARYELEKLKAEADKNVVNVSKRAEAVAELQNAGMEAIKLNRRVMNSSKVDVKIRTRVATHFMDRVVFEKVDKEDEVKVSYRDILRGLGRLEERLSTTTIITEATNVNDP
jgi:hypothetical protein